EPGAAYVVSAEESPGFLAPWPVAVLDDPEHPDDALGDLLVRLGLRTLGAFAALPEGAVLGRFGSAGARAHRLAPGMDAPPPRRRPRRWPRPPSSPRPPSTSKPPPSRPRAWRSGSWRDSGDSASRAPA